MGDPLATIDMGLRGGAGAPSNTMWPGPRPIYLLFKESVANDVLNVSFFACCQPRHRRVEASSVGLY